MISKVSMFEAEQKVCPFFSIAVSSTDSMQSDKLMMLKPSSICSSCTSCQHASEGSPIVGSTGGSLDC